MTRSPFFPQFLALPTAIPVFPLAGAVVMPGVQLPLNIFEPRYLNMVADALAGDHIIGMVQPARGGSEDQPAIHRIGCAGRITSYSETNDGRIVLVLTGLCRFVVVQELPGRRGYRRVEPAWDRFAIDYDDVDMELGDRGAFMDALRRYTEVRGVEVPWEDVDKMGDADLVNLLCTHLPLEPEDKQALVETISLDERAELMRGLMQMSVTASIASTEHHH